MNRREFLLCTAFTLGVALAAHALKLGEPPRAIRNSRKLLEDFQNSLVSQGFELDWPRLRPL